MTPAAQLMGLPTGSMCSGPLPALLGQWSLGAPPGVQPPQALYCNPWVGKIPWRREWLPTPVNLPGEFHGQRSLAGIQPMGLQRVRQD